MTEVVRLTLVSHAMTDAMAAGRFPADEPLNDVGRRQAQAAADEIGSGKRLFAGPERRTRETATLLGLQAIAEPRLADLDAGRWRGAALGDLPPEELETWLTDPTRAPHGGESITGLVDRVAGWLKSLTDNTLPTVAVTHPAVVRAAIMAGLGIPSAAFWRIDVAPAGRVVLHFRAGSWTLRL
ncbi:histidine phosphatase family protein [Mycobacterium marseillense]|uniref:Histidine phosphatase family protein n=1 Tax=Mycobacterium marseillense TaxID=701042 RepID=A0AAC9VRS7_9MYCO|nr:histidine phosphatase family protein [Mycobacterium marseillense]ASW88850.1 histidine phosphatase family protein [Mycobacterium marseillense]MDM3974246.1 histidine phosphatase family protein [Mycobacterium marseillense]